LRRFQKAAISTGVTLSEWARQVLRRAEQQSSNTDPGEKLAAIRTVSDYAFPAPEIGSMLAEIERGYQTPTQQ